MSIFFNSIPIEELALGMSASYTQTITDSDIKSFAGISGDHNPIHVDENYIEKSRFKKRVVHGLMPTSFFSGIFGTKLPGPGCLYVSQSIQFKKPIYINDTVTATVEIISIDTLSRHIKFKTTCIVRNKTAIDGIADIFVPKDA
ncbi:MAG: MaoC family dehydratase [Pseudomonadota bacterium]